MMFAICPDDLQVFQATWVIETEVNVKCAVTASSLGMLRDIVSAGGSQARRPISTATYEGSHEHNSVAATNAIILAKMGTTQYNDTDIGSADAGIHRKREISCAYMRHLQLVLVAAPHRFDPGNTIVLSNVGSPHQGVFLYVIGNPIAVLDTFCKMASTLGAIYKRHLKVMTPNEFYIAVTAYRKRRSVDRYCHGISYHNSTHTGAPNALAVSCEDIAVDIHTSYYDIPSHERLGMGLGALPQGLCRWLIDPVVAHDQGDASSHTARSPTARLPTTSEVMKILHMLGSPSTPGFTRSSERADCSNFLSVVPLSPEENQVILGIPSREDHVVNPIALCPHCGTVNIKRPRGTANRRHMCRFCGMTLGTAQRSYNKALYYPISFWEPRYGMVGRNNDGYESGADPTAEPSGQDALQENHQAVTPAEVQEVQVTQDPGFRYHTKCGHHFTCMSCSSDHDTFISISAVNSLSPGALKGELLTNVEMKPLDGSGVMSFNDMSRDGTYNYYAMVFSQQNLMMVLQSLSSMIPVAIGNCLPGTSVQLVHHHEAAAICRFVVIHEPCVVMLYRCPPEPRLGTSAWRVRMTARTYGANSQSFIVSNSPISWAPPCKSFMYEWGCGLLRQIVTGHGLQPVEPTVLAGSCAPGTVVRAKSLGDRDNYIVIQAPEGRAPALVACSREGKTLMATVHSGQVRGSNDKLLRLHTTRPNRETPSDDSGPSRPHITAAHPRMLATPPGEWFNLEIVVKCQYPECFVTGSDYISGYVGSSPEGFLYVTNTPSTWELFTMDGLQSCSSHTSSPQIKDIHGAMILRSEGGLTLQTMCRLQDVGDVPLSLVGRFLYGVEGHYASAWKPECGFRPRLDWSYRSQPSFQRVTTMDPNDRTALGHMYAHSDNFTYTAESRGCYPAHMGPLAHSIQQEMMLAICEDDLQVFQAPFLLSSEVDVDCPESASGVTTLQQICRECQDLPRPTISLTNYDDSDKYDIVATTNAVILSRLPWDSDGVNLNNWDEFCIDEWREITCALKRHLQLVLIAAPYRFDAGSTIVFSNVHSVNNGAFMYILGNPKAVLDAFCRMAASLRPCDCRNMRVMTLNEFYIAATNAPEARRTHLCWLHHPYVIPQHSATNATVITSCDTVGGDISTPYLALPAEDRLHIGLGPQPDSIYSWLVKPINAYGPGMPRHHAGIQNYKGRLPTTDEVMCLARAWRTEEISRESIIVYSYDREGASNNWHVVRPSGRGAGRTDLSIRAKREGETYLMVACSHCGTVNGKRQRPPNDRRYMCRVCGMALGPVTGDAYKIANYQPVDFWEPRYGMMSSRQISYGMVPDDVGPICRKACMDHDMRVVTNFCTRNNKTTVWTPAGLQPDQAQVITEATGYSLCCTDIPCAHAMLAAERKVMYSYVSERLHNIGQYLDVGCRPSFVPKEYKGKYHGIYVLQSYKDLQRRDLVDQKLCTLSDYHDLDGSKANMMLIDTYDVTPKELYDAMVRMGSTVAYLSLSTATVDFDSDDGELSHDQGYWWHDGDNFVCALTGSLQPYVNSWELTKVWSTSDVISMPGGALTMKTVLTVGNHILRVVSITNMPDIDTIMNKACLRETHLHVTVPWVDMKGMNEGAQLADCIVPRRFKATKDLLIRCANRYITGRGSLVESSEHAIGLGFFRYVMDDNTFSFNDHDPEDLLIHMYLARLAVKLHWLKLTPTMMLSKCEMRDAGALSGPLTEMAVNMLNQSIKVLVEMSGNVEQSLVTTTLASIIKGDPMRGHALAQDSVKLASLHDTIGISKSVVVQYPGSSLRPPTRSGRLCHCHKNTCTHTCEDPSLVCVCCQWASHSGHLSRKCECCRNATCKHNHLCPHYCHGPSAHLCGEGCTHNKVLCDCCGAGYCCMLENCPVCVGPTNVGKPVAETYATVQKPNRFLPSNPQRRPASSSQPLGSVQTGKDTVYETNRSVTLPRQLPRSRGDLEDHVQQNDKTLDDDAVDALVNEGQMPDLTRTDGGPGVEDDSYGPKTFASVVSKTVLRQHKAKSRAEMDAAARLSETASEDEATMWAQCLAAFGAEYTAVLRYGHQKAWEDKHVKQDPFSGTRDCKTKVRFVPIGVWRCAGTPFIKVSAKIVPNVSSKDCGYQAFTKATGKAVTRSDFFKVVGKLDDLDESDLVKAARYYRTNLLLISKNKYSLVKAEVENDYFPTIMHGSFVGEGVIEHWYPGCALQTGCHSKYPVPNDGCSMNERDIMYSAAEEDRRESSFDSMACELRAKVELCLHLDISKASAAADDMDLAPRVVADGKGSLFLSNNPDLCANDINAGKIHVKIPAWASDALNWMTTAGTDYKGHREYTAPYNFDGELKDDMSGDIKARLWEMAKMYVATLHSDSVDKDKHVKRWSTGSSERCTKERDGYKCRRPEAIIKTLDLVMVQQNNNYFNTWVLCIGQSMFLKLKGNNSTAQIKILQLQNSTGSIIRSILSLLAISVTGVEAKKRLAEGSGLRAYPGHGKTYEVAKHADKESIAIAQTSPACENLRKAASKLGKKIKVMSVERFLAVNAKCSTLHIDEATMIDTIVFMQIISKGSFNVHLYFDTAQIGCIDAWISGGARWLSEPKSIADYVPEEVLQIEVSTKRFGKEWCEKCQCLFPGIDPDESFVTWDTTLEIKFSPTWGKDVLKEFLDPASSVITFYNQDKADLESWFGNLLKTKGDGIVETAHRFQGSQRDKITVVQRYDPDRKETLHRNKRYVSAAISRARLQLVWIVVGGPHDNVEDLYDEIGQGIPEPYRPNPTAAGIALTIKKMVAGEPLQMMPEATPNGPALKKEMSIKVPADFNDTATINSMLQHFRAKFGVSIEYEVKDGLMTMTISMGPMHIGTITLNNMLELVRLEPGAMTFGMFSDERVLKELEKLKGGVSVEDAPFRCCKNCKEDCEPMLGLHNMSPGVVNAIRVVGFVTKLTEQSGESAIMQVDTNEVKVATSVCCAFCGGLSFSYHGGQYDGVEILRIGEGYLNLNKRALKWNDKDEHYEMLSKLSAWIGFSKTVVGVSRSGVDYSNYIPGVNLEDRSMTWALCMERIFQVGSMMFRKVTGVGSDGVNDSPWQIWDYHSKVILDQVGTWCKAEGLTLCDLNKAALISNKCHILLARVKPKGMMRFFIGQGSKQVLFVFDDECKILKTYSKDSTALICKDSKGAVTMPRNGLMSAAVSEFKARWNPKECITRVHNKGRFGAPPHLRSMYWSLAWHMDNDTDVAKKYKTVSDHVRLRTIRRYESSLWLTSTQYELYSRQLSEMFPGVSIMPGPLVPGETNLDGLLNRCLIRWYCSEPSVNVLYLGRYVHIPSTTGTISTVSKLKEGVCNDRSLFKHFVSEALNNLQTRIAALSVMEVKEGRNVDQLATLKNILEKQQYGDAGPMIYDDVDRIMPKNFNEVAMGVEMCTLSVEALEQLMDEYKCETILGIVPMASDVSTESHYKLSDDGDNMVAGYVATGGSGTVYNLDKTTYSHAVSGHKIRSNGNASKVVFFEVESVFMRHMIVRFHRCSLELVPLYSSPVMDKFSPKLTQVTLPSVERDDSCAVTGLKLVARKCLVDTIIIRHARLHLCHEGATITSALHMVQSKLSGVLYAKTGLSSVFSVSTGVAIDSVIVAYHIHHQTKTSLARLDFMAGDLSHSAAGLATQVSSVVDNLAVVVSNALSALDIDVSKGAVTTLLEKCVSSLPGWMSEILDFGKVDTRIRITDDKRALLKQNFGSSGLVVESTADHKPKDPFGFDLIGKLINQMERLPKNPASTTPAVPVDRPSKYQPIPRAGQRATAEEKGKVHIANLKANSYDAVAPLPDNDIFNTMYANLVGPHHDTILRCKGMYGRQAPADVRCVCTTGMMIRNNDKFEETVKNLASRVRNRVLDYMHCWVVILEKCNVTVLRALRETFPEVIFVMKPHELAGIGHYFNIARYIALKYQFTHWFVLDESWKDNDNLKHMWGKFREACADVVNLSEPIENFSSYEVSTGPAGTELSKHVRNKIKFFWMARSPNESSTHKEFHWTPLSLRPSVVSTEFLQKCGSFADKNNWPDRNPAADGVDIEKQSIPVYTEFMYGVVACKYGFNFTRAGQLFTRPSTHISTYTADDRPLSVNGCVEFLKNHGPVIFDPASVGDQAGEPDGDDAVYHSCDEGDDVPEPPQVGLTAEKDKKALLITIGSRGDLVPFVEIGKKLEIDGYKIFVSTHYDILQSIEKPSTWVDLPQTTNSQQCTAIACSEVLSNPVVNMKAGVRYYQEFARGVQASMQGVNLNFDVVVGSHMTPLVEHVANISRARLIWTLPFPWNPPEMPDGVLTKCRSKHYGPLKRLMHCSKEAIFWKASLTHTAMLYAERDLEMPAGDIRDFGCQPVMYTFSSHLYNAMDTSGENVTVMGQLETPTDSVFKGDPIVETITGGGWAVITFGSLPIRNAPAVLNAAVGCLVRGGFSVVVNTGVLTRPEHQYGNFRITDPSSRKEDGSPVTLRMVNGEASLKVRVVEGFNFTKHLNKFELCLCHGGSGVVHSALKASCFVIIHPSFGDQYIWAHCVREAGVGSGWYNDQESGLQKVIDAYDHDKKGFCDRVSDMSANLRVTNSDVILAETLARILMRPPDTFMPKTQYEDLPEMEDDPGLDISLPSGIKPVNIPAPADWRDQTMEGDGSVSKLRLYASDTLDTLHSVVTELVDMVSPAVQLITEGDCSSYQRFTTDEGWPCIAVTDALVHKDAGAETGTIDHLLTTNGDYLGRACSGGYIDWEKFEGLLLCDLDNLLLLSSMLPNWAGLSHVSSVVIDLAGVVPLMDEVWNSIDRSSLEGALRAGLEFVIQGSDRLGISCVVVLRTGDRRLDPLILSQIGVARKPSQQITVEWLPRDQDMHVRGGHRARMDPCLLVDEAMQLCQCPGSLQLGDGVVTTLHNLVSIHVNMCGSEKLLLNDCFRSSGSLITNELSKPVAQMNANTQASGSASASTTAMDTTSLSSITPWVLRTDQLFYSFGMNDDEGLHEGVAGGVAVPSSLTDIGEYECTCSPYTPLFDPRTVAHCVNECLKTAVQLYAKVTLQQACLDVLRRIALPSYASEQEAVGALACLGMNAVVVTGSGSTLYKFEEGDKGRFVGLLMQDGHCVLIGDFTVLAITLKVRTILPQLNSDLAAEASVRKILEVTGPQPGSESCLSNLYATGDALTVDLKPWCTSFGNFNAKKRARHLDKIIGFVNNPVVFTDLVTHANCFMAGASRRLRVGRAYFVKTTRGWKLCIALDVDGMIGLFGGLNRDNAMGVVVDACIPVIKKVDKEGMTGKEDLRHSKMTFLSKDCRKDAHEMGKYKNVHTVGNVHAEKVLVLNYDNWEHHLHSQRDTLAEFDQSNTLFLGNSISNTEYDELIQGSRNYGGRVWYHHGVLKLEYSTPSDGHAVMVRKVLTKLGYGGTITGTVVTPGNMLDVDGRRDVRDILHAYMSFNGNSYEQTTFIGSRYSKKCVVTVATLAEQHELCEDDINHVLSTHTSALTRSAGLASKVLVSREDLKTDRVSAQMWQQVSDKGNWLQAGDNVGYCCLKTWTYVTILARGSGLVQKSITVAAADTSDHLNNMHDPTKKPTAADKKMDSRWFGTRSNDEGSSSKMLSDRVKQGYSLGAEAMMGVSPAHHGEVRFMATRVGEQVQFSYPDTGNIFVTSYEAEFSSKDHVETLPAEVLELWSRKDLRDSVELRAPKKGALRSRETPFKTTKLSKTTMVPAPLRSRPVLVKRFGSETGATTRLYDVKEYKRTVMGVDACINLLRAAYWIAGVDTYALECRVNEIGLNSKATLAWLAQSNNPTKISGLLHSANTDGMELNPLNSAIVMEKLESLLKDNPIADWDEGKVRIIVYQMQGHAAVFSPPIMEVKNRMKAAEKMNCKYIDGKTPPEIAKWVSAFHSGVMYMEDDLEAQDRQTPVDIIDVEMYLLKYFGVNQALVNLWRVTHENWRFKGRFSSGTRNAMRWTGQVTTALGNYIVNMLVRANWVLRNASYITFTLKLGDDFLAAMTTKVDVKQYEREAKQYWNMVAKAECKPSCGTICCMLVITDSMGHPHLVPDITRLYHRYQVTNGIHKINTTSLDSRRMAYLAMLGKCPETIRICRERDYDLKLEAWYDMNAALCASAEKWGTAYESVLILRGKLLAMIDSDEVYNHEFLVYTSYRAAPKIRMEDWVPSQQVHLGRT
jgi:UDP:flavonoid glycosyltransferase YjiC (YdhE family)